VDIQTFDTSMRSGSRFEYHDRSTIDLENLMAILMLLLLVQWSCIYQASLYGIIIRQSCQVFIHYLNMIQLRDISVSLSTFFVLAIIPAMFTHIV